MRVSEGETERAKKMQSILRKQNEQFKFSFDANFATLSDGYYLRKK